MNQREMVNERDIYLFNPDYVMRNDSRRVVLFSKNKTTRLSVPNWESFLHPLHAQIFSFFTFNHSLGDTLSQLGKFLNRDGQAVRKIVFPFIENPQSVYINFKDDKIRIPKNIIVNRNQIADDVAFLNLQPNSFNCSDIDVSSCRNYTGPQLLTFMLNNTCITHCIYCYADIKTKVQNRLTTARILELIEEAHTLPVRFVNLMGGELFLHRDWNIILKKLVDYNLSPEYISTKYPLTEKIVQSIQETGFTNPVQLSLDACSQNILYETLSANSYYLPKVLQGVRLLDESGLNYRINTVLTIYNANKEEIEKLYRFISDLKNIADWRITPAVDSNWIEYDRFQKIKPEKEEIESLYEWIEKEITPHLKIPIILNKPAIEREFHYSCTGSAGFKGTRCPALNNQLFILPDGQVTICEQLYWMPQFIIGDVSENSVPEVWNSPAAHRLLNLTKEDIRDNSQCKTCKLFEPCFNAGKRCWLDIAKAYGKENWDYPDPRCAFSPEMINDLRY